ncbi:DUF3106 domain-containing protein [Burkholderia pseudomallei]|uniref:DUF3106 domain-containing protein n=1 Tax=Burkholderia pseudomallei TaxID=28450 RepID=UPI00014FA237|nr:DUF3106 domain-containing protein [Burkholderia pseudomallei]AGR73457.1 hypothetical protein BDL_835 [Burkholderia pseudomallei MSHR305]AHK66652.1 hypothetical protein BBX_2776 [Burkholderia pseudomallei MSHR520]AIP80437.1 hypothetical protein JE55_2794 [Burkholderia pseudomallei]APZ17422.1 hypothetical protein BGI47_01475 [Burkholderia pseudomallei]APZ23616.1 hypothetical protein BGI46_01475 [Burkholderia pseudomallei]
MSQKRGLAVFFGCVIALVVAYAATYPRFHPQPAAVAAASAPVIASAAIALSSGEFPPLPPSSPLSWGRLTPQQHVALAPFASQWDSFSDERKRKWLKIAARFPRMSPEAQKRLQERMTEWVRMTPEQRRVARENYLVSKDLSAQAREKAWKAYQQLSPEQKEKLAAAERRRRPTVVSAPPTGKTDRDINRLVNAHDRHPASAPTASIAPSSASAPAAAPVPASPATTGAVTPPTAPTPVSPSEAPSLFNGS